MSFNKEILKRLELETMLQIFVKFRRHVLNIKYKLTICKFKQNSEGENFIIKKKIIKKYLLYFLSYKKI